MLPKQVDPARIDHPPKDLPGAHPPPPLLSSPSCSSSGSSSSRTHQPQKPPIRQVQNVQSPGAQHHQLRNYPMVAMPTSPSAKEVAISEEFVKFFRVICIIRPVTKLWNQTDTIFGCLNTSLDQIFQNSKKNPLKIFWADDIFCCVSNDMYMKKIGFSGWYPDHH